MRIYLGFFWLTYGVSKFEPDWAGGKREFLQAVQFSAQDTGEPYKSFLTTVVIPHQAVFAELIAYGETLVGIALILGLLTKVGTIGGMFLTFNYFFAIGAYKVWLGLHATELLLFVLSFYLTIVPTEKYFSLDAIVWKWIRFPKRGFGPRS
jgi:thiosulfate dehydrogenase [quinone] large subunit